MKQKYVTLDEVKKDIEILEKIYDEVRIVDPINKKVLNIKDEIIEVPHSRCYMSWKAKKECKDCIAQHSIHQKRSSIKIEHDDEKTYMIKAIPIKGGSRTLVLELLEDVSDKGILYGEIGQKSEEILEEMDRKDELVNQDGLTGAYNRRFIDENLADELAQSYNDGEYVSIVMTDMDNLKQINDEYGHLCGDMAIQDFYRILEKSIRKENDWIARYGGDEFLIFLANADEEAALSITNRVIENMKNHKIDYENNNVDISCSFGICTLYGKHVDSKELVKVADDNLYKAKSSESKKTVISRYK